MTRQTLILNKMQKMATEVGYTFIDNPVWANTGNCEILDDDLNCIVRFGYSFQNAWKNMSFAFFPNDKHISRRFAKDEPIKHDYIDFDDTAKLKDMLNWFGKQLEAINAV